MAKIIHKSQCGLCRQIKILHKKNKVKLNILNILNEKYGIKERDFTSAELEIVPAFKAKSVGLEEVTGSIQAERNADFLVVDKDWNLEQVYIDGTLFTK